MRYKARDSKAFANNGTLYFPKGEYPGAFVFDFKSGVRNEINITGDGHGSVLITNGSDKPVVILGLRILDIPNSSNWMWAKIANLTINGLSKVVEKQPPVNGVEFLNPSEPSYIKDAGRWVLERILFTNCHYGVYKQYGNIGNHFIDCTFDHVKVGVFAQGGDGLSHAGCDRYSGGAFQYNELACLQYVGSAAQIIVDGTVFEFNATAWAISIKLQNKDRMTQNAICIRNAWFESNGSDTGGDMEFEGVRSVRIDDCRLMCGMHLRDSSVNLYNCQLSFHGANALSDWYLVDKTSSLVAYELRFDGYPTNKVFVNSISYDGSQDISHMNWQPTSVWGPLRCVIATRPQNIVVSNHFDTYKEPFINLSGGSGTWSYPSLMHVLANGSGKLSITPGRFRCDTVFGNIHPGKYIVWSIHTFLESPVPEEHFEDELFGDIKRNYDDMRLGFIYFKYGQWVCSYGMKLVDIDHDSEMRLDFESTFNATFYTTDYQIVEFDSLHDANAYVNSREFAILPAQQ